MREGMWWKERRRGGAECAPTSSRSKQSRGPAGRGRAAVCIGCFRVAESRLCALANSPRTALIGAAVRRALRKYVAEQRGVGNSYSFVGALLCAGKEQMRC
ncbi:hypothetical protein L1887_58569 [Cichorium endivia]|nr:hypothetical protein L1887_58569 [Cichorium endivia]